jgi:hypothetical protein
VGSGEGALAGARRADEDDQGLFRKRDFHGPTGAAKGSGLRPKPSFPWRVDS